MAFEVAGQRITLKSSVAITERYVAVKVVADETVAPAAAGDVCIGFAQLPVKAGEGAVVQINGVTFAIAGGAITAGQTVVPAANGRVVAGTTSPVGVALNTVTTAGAVIGVVQRPN